MDKEVLVVSIPGQASPELTYIIGCIFEDFLGLVIDIKTHVSPNEFIIKSSNGRICLPNLFFSNDISTLYKIENIPAQVDKDDWSLDGLSYPIVSLYGPARFNEQEDGFRLETDLFANIFFMLSRWEEFANPERDVHQRFPAEASLAYKFDFLDRPIVNEYLEVLKVLLRKIGLQQEYKVRDFKIVPTHDVDSPFFWWSKRKKAKTVFKAAIKGHKKLLCKHLRHIRNGTDPYDTFDLMMDASERIGTSSHFFFITGGTTRYDLRYKIDHPRVVELIERIKSRVII